MLDTLPDYLRLNMRILSIGINPSLPSVRAGFYFANPRNRFWRALQGSGLVDADIIPGIEAMQLLLDRYGIGFTDVAKRPTAGAKDLLAADYRRDAPRLKAMLLQYQPDVAWFHGKLAWQYYQQYAEGRRERSDWGLQPQQVGGTRIYVTPNPSPANAAFSLAVLTDWYQQLGHFVSLSARSGDEAN